MSVVNLDDHRECDPLFDVRVYRHPNGSIMANVCDAHAAWFAETPGQSNVERMLAAADLLPLASDCMRQHAAELRADGEETHD